MWSASFAFCRTECTNMSETRHNARRLKGFGYFCLIAAALVFLFGVASPRFVATSPNLQRYGALQDELGIHSGLMYYTDLKTQQETQDIVRYALERSGNALQ